MTWSARILSRSKASLGSGVTVLNLSTILQIFTEKEEKTNGIWQGTPVGAMSTVSPDTHIRILCVMHDTPCSTYTKMGGSKWIMAKKCSECL